MSTRIPVRPVVVGVDGSPTNALAVSWAVDYAQARSTPLRLVAAYQPDALEAGLAAAGTGLERANRSALAVARGHLEAAARYARSLGFDRPLETACIADPASHALLAEARDAELVVVGSRRLGRLHRAFAGSTGAVTSAKAACPVVVVRERASRSLGDTRVIVGVDGPGSRDAAAFAMAEAQRTGAGLTAVHVWELNTAHLGALVSPAMERQRLEARGGQLLDEMVTPLSEAHPDVEIRRYVTEGVASDVLEKLSENARMLVVGSRGLRTVPALLLGSVSRRMITHAHCPVAIVHGHDPGTSRRADDFSERPNPAPVG